MYFLAAEYWSSTQRNECPVLDDSKGITLNSLGGIFLATLVGLLLSMITLAYEVWQQKKREKDQVVELSPDNSQGKIVSVGSKNFTLGADGVKPKDDMGMPTISGFY